MREVTFDALVQRTLHPPRILRNPVSGGGSPGLSSTASAQASSSGASRSARRQLSTTSPAGRGRITDSPGYAPFSSSPGGSGRSGGRRRAQGDVNLTARLSL